MKIFDPMNFQENESKKIKIHRLEFWLRYTGESWELSYHYQNEYDNFSIENNCSFEPFKTEKWVFSEPYPTIFLKPVLADKPVLTEFKNPTSVLAGEKICLFEQIPASIDIMIKTPKKEIKLKQLSIIPEQLTWLGDPLDGELCYHDTAEAVFNEKLIQYQSGAIICPIIINNQSNHTYPLKQLVIRTEFLGIFIKNNQLWTNMMKIEYYGDDKENPIDILPLENTVQLTPPREDIRQQSRLIKRISNFRSFIS
ncbi:MAG TPA: DUF432 domain-containing protein [Candidatus Cloacimonadota bacterium]|nr:DUF432 domain-containing protein [Candidatus Cloacimonadota bacterium]